MTKSLKRGRIAIVFLLVLFLSVCIEKVYAEGFADIEIDPDDEASVVVLEERDFFPMLRGAYLMLGSTSLVDNGDGTIAINGFTQAHQYCDELTLELVLEQFDSDTDSWKSISYWSTTRYDDTHLMKGYTVLVPLKKYYRLRGYHRVTHNGESEYVFSTTGALFIK